MQEPEEDEFFQYYLSIGAIELAAIDENGELVFKITEDAQEIAPELWKAHKEYVDNTLIDLLNKDLISVEYNEDLQATISLTPEAYKIIEQKGIHPIED